MGNALSTKRWFAKHPEKYAEYAAKYKSYRRNWHLQKFYGISTEEYSKLAQQQDFKCAICSVIDDGLHVDHNHKTKTVRGLLCGPCNRALGLFRDSQHVLANALIYLEKHNGR